MAWRQKDGATNALPPRTAPRRRISRRLISARSGWLRLALGAAAGLERVGLAHAAGGLEPGARVNRQATSLDASHQERSRAQLDAHALAHSTVELAEDHQPPGADRAAYGCPRADDQQLVGTYLAPQPAVDPRVRWEAQLAGDRDVMRERVGELWELVRPVCASRHGSWRVDLRRRPRAGGLAHWRRPEVKRRVVIATASLRSATADLATALGGATASWPEESHRSGLTAGRLPPESGPPCRSVLSSSRASPFAPGPG